MQILDIVRGALTGAGATALLLGALRILEYWQAPVAPWVLLAVAGAFFVAGAAIPAQDDAAETADTDDPSDPTGEDELAASLAEAAQALSARGTSDLGTLLARMDPVVLDDEFVFITVPEDPDEWPHAIADAEPLGTFREEEGETWIVPRSVADQAEMTYDAVFRGITLSVHSSLTAVGFLAVITYALSEQGIAVNVVSATYHDHLFIPKERIRETLVVLEALQKGASDE